MVTAEQEIPTTGEQAAQILDPRDALPKFAHMDVQGWFDALGVFGNRKMANTKADLKVGRLLAWLMPLATPLKPARSKIALEVTNGLSNEDVVKMSPLQQQIIQAKIAGLQLEFDAETMRVALPDSSLRITEADLPKEMAGENGWQNASQLGALVANLGPLYEWKD